MNERPTPETDAAVKASDGQWSFVLKETCQRLERERDEARAERDGAREVAKFWQEQYSAVYPSHKWVQLPWEKKQ